MTTITDNCKLIAARCPALAAEAVQTMRAEAAGSPILHSRYARLLQGALGAGEFTEAERAALVAPLTLQPAGARDQQVNVRLSAAEREELTAAAEAAGVGLSELVRERALYPWGEA
jgi:hypothetical protein